MEDFLNAVRVALWLCVMVGGVMVAYAVLQVGRKIGNWFGGGR